MRGRRGERKGPYQMEEEREGMGISGGSDSDRSDLSTTLTHGDLVGRGGQRRLWPAFSICCDFCKCLDSC